MDRNQLEKFLALKDTIMDNLEVLKMYLDTISQEGFSDPESALYNQITDLVDQTDSITIPQELETIIIRGRTIERNLDSWLSREGRSSLELEWPDITLFLSGQ
ncbi:MAG: hypothetical protein JW769_01575 [Parachlamydiales bacterium]|nr:hypothetical protein [Parachlamydiales bacterium]